MRNQGSRLPRRKIGVKYCGGCSSGYDRVAIANRIGESLSESWEMVSWEDPSADHILAVTGCNIACIDPRTFGDKPVHWLNSEQNFQQIIDRFKEIAYEPG